MYLVLVHIHTYMNVYNVYIAVCKFGIHCKMSSSIVVGLPGYHIRAWSVCSCVCVCVLLYLWSSFCVS